MDIKKSLLIEKACEIAVSDLRVNYGNLGIYAGPKNFREYWARDSFFASYGAFVLGDFEIVKKNLDLFSFYQSPSGHIPVRVEERFHGLGLFGININHKKPVPLFRPSQPWAGEVVDSNPLYLICLSEYVVRTKNFEWVKQNEKNILRAISWIVKKFDNKDLFTEGINAGWADFTFKRGNVFYTNILIWHAFKLLCEALPPESASYCVSLTKKLEESIKLNFWDDSGGYFIDHIGIHGNKHKVFASDGNLLAIFYNFVDEKKSRRIIKFIDNHGSCQVPVPIYFQGLEWKHKILNSLIYPNYNIDNTFLWWGSVSSVCRAISGDKAGSLNDLTILAKIIVKYKAVPEVVDPEGNLSKTFFYKSELRSSWAAGLYVYAVNFAKERGILK